MHYYIQAAIPKPIIVTNEVEKLASEAFNILLEWIVQGEIRGLMYNISISPQANIQYTGMRNAKLNLSYNIPYNVSIATLCGDNSSPPLYITLHYGKLIIFDLSINNNIIAPLSTQVGVSIH